MFVQVSVEGNSVTKFHLSGDKIEKIFFKELVCVDGTDTKSPYLLSELFSFYLSHLTVKQELGLSLSPFPQLSTGHTLN